MSLLLSYSQKIIPYAIILLLFSPSENPQFLAIFLALGYLLLKKKFFSPLDFKKQIIQNSLPKCLIFLFVIQLVNYIYAVMFKRTDLLSFPLFIFSFWSPMIFLLLIERNNYKKMRTFLEIVILAEMLIVVFFQALRLDFMPGDYAKGTTSSAHWIGFCAVWLMYGYILHKKFSFLNVLIVLLAGLALFLSDAKTVLASVIIYFPIGAIILRKVLKNNKACLKFVMFVAIISVILFTDLFMDRLVRKNNFFQKRHSVRKNMLDMSAKNNTQGKYLSSLMEVGKKYSPAKFIDLYINGQMNHKYLFIRRGLDYLKQNNLLLIGTSPGTLGSRASNIRARDVLYKPEGPKGRFLKTYSSQATKEVYDGLFTEDYHERASIYINILSLPFSSFFSFLFENGLIGMLALLLCIFVLVRQFFICGGIYSIESIFLIFLVFSWGTLDTVWERSFLMGLFYLLISINLKFVKYESTSSN